MRIHNGTVIGVVAAAAPILAVLAPLGLAPLLACVAVAAILVRRFRDGVWPTPPFWLCAFIGLVATWALLSAAWSIAPVVSLEKVPRFFLVLATGLVLTDAAVALMDDERRRIGIFFLFGFIAGLVLMVVELVGDGPVHRLLVGAPEDTYELLNYYNRSASVIAVFVWPVALVAGRLNRYAGVAVWPLVLALILFFVSDAAVVAMGLGLVAFVWSLVWPRIGPPILGALMILVVLGAPFVQPPGEKTSQYFAEFERLPRSAYHRLLIWRFTAERVAERPILGWGFNASRVIPGGDKQIDTFEIALPLHPHNAALQWWLELGAVGAALGAGVIAWLLMTIRRTDATAAARATASGLMVSAISVSFLSYGAWQSWWLAVLWLSAAFMVALIRDTRPPPPSPP